MKVYNNNHLECNILTINDIVNNANYSKFIDSIGRKDRDYVYISIVKFEEIFLNNKHGRSYGEAVIT